MISFILFFYLSFIFSGVPEGEYRGLGLPSLLNYDLRDMLKSVIKFIMKIESSKGVKIFRDAYIIYPRYLMSKLHHLLLLPEEIRSSYFIFTLIAYYIINSSFDGFTKGFGLS